MINEWLSRRKPLRNLGDRLQDAIVEYWASVICEDRLEKQQVLVDIFYEIAESIVNFKCRNQRLDYIFAEDAVQECVLIAWEKTERYDPKKGRALNFFTTVMMSQLRQLYRAPKRYNHLKDQYLQTVLRFSEDQIIYMNIGDKGEEHMA